MFSETKNPGTLKASFAKWKRARNMIFESCFNILIGTSKGFHPNDMTISKLSLFKQYNSRIETWIVGVKGGHADPWSSLVAVDSK